MLRPNNRDFLNPLQGWLVTLCPSNKLTLHLKAQALYQVMLKLKENSEICIGKSTPLSRSKKLSADPN